MAASLLDQLRRSPRRASVLAGLCVVALGGLLVGLHVRDYERVSPSDELQHYDYLVRLMRDGEVVRRGDLFAEESLRTEACQGLDAPFSIPRCGLHRYRAGDFQEGGYNTAYIHPPTYYGISGAGAAALSAATGSDSLFTTGRLMGTVWLMGALALLWLAMGELGVPWSARAVSVVLVMTAPVVLEATATINPDATALFAGSSVLYAVLRWERHRRWWPTALAATFALALKSTNIIALVVGLAYVGLRQLEGRRASRASGSEPMPRESLVLAASILGGAGLVAILWVGVSSAMALVPTEEIPMAARFHADSIGVADVLRNTNTGFTPLDTPYIPAELATAWAAPVAVLVDRLFLVGLGVAAFASPTGSRMRAIALATLVALAVVGPAFVVANFVLQGTYVDIPRRYGLAAVPGMVVALTFILRDRRVLVVVGAASGVALLATVRGLLG